MVDEQYDDKYDGQEEGEYHFSDDQVNYEVEPETPKGGAATAAVTAVSQQPGSKTQQRRIVMGVVVFIVLLAIVFKMISPGTNTPSTEFSSQTTPAINAAPKTPALNNHLNQPAQIPAAQQTAAMQPAPAPSIATQQPVAAPAPVEQSTAMPQTGSSMATTSPEAAPAATSYQTQQSAQPVVTSASSTNENETTTGTPGQQSNSALDRISALEQQNSAIMNLLQTQVAQKISDQDAQNAQLRTQVQELNTRLATMEVAFHQLTKMLRGGGGNNSNSYGNSRSHVSISTNEEAIENMEVGAGSNASAPAKMMSSSKSLYTVQAIIPGRAWLKSDAGDTVTVAEGDVIRDFGRITKIDPYDGIVDIDTGNKTVTLSYGSNGD